MVAIREDLIRWLLLVLMAFFILQGLYMLYRTPILVEYHVYSTIGLWWFYPILQLAAIATQGLAAYSLWQGEYRWHFLFAALIIPLAQTLIAIVIAMAVVDFHDLAHRLNAAMVEYGYRLPREATPTLPTFTMPRLLRATGLAIVLILLYRYRKQTAQERTAG